MPTKSPRPEQVAPSPMWTLEKGVSYSLLSRFINCRERFRLYAVEGVREESSSRGSMDFGTYFHELLELHAKYPNLSANAVIQKAKKHPERTLKIQAETVFFAYCAWYSENRYSYHDQECEFKINYKLPNGKNIRLVGKSDEIINSPNNDGTLWIQENKTKENINEYKIESSIPWDLQSLMYAIAISKHFKRPVTGLVYNVIRKPSIRPKNIKDPVTSKARKEDSQEFNLRLAEEIEKNPGHYFKRWEIPLTEDHIERWRKTTFDPLLMQLCLWWESIRHDPFSPWETLDELGSLLPNPHHYQRPFGIYDSMTLGTGDYFDLITRNRKLGTTSGNKCFSELEFMKEE